MKVLFMNVLRLRSLTLIFLVWMASTAAADWSAYLNGNQRAGFTPSTIDTPFQLAWTYQPPAKPMMAWSGPRNEPIEGHEMRHRVDFDDAMQVVMSDGLAYFGNTVDHRLHCVEAKTGKPVWSFYTDGPIRLAPTLAHGNVYFGSDDGARLLSRRPRWKGRLEDARRTQGRPTAFTRRDDFTLAGTNWRADRW